MIRGRLATLYRKVFPAGREREWDTLLAHINERWELGHDDATLRQMAREGAATGRDSGDVLAELLVEQAARAERP